MASCRIRPPRQLHFQAKKPWGGTRQAQTKTPSPRASERFQADPKREMGGSMADVVESALSDLLDTVLPQLQSEIQLVERLEAAAQAPGASLEQRKEAQIARSQADAKESEFATRLTAQIIQAKKTLAQNPTSLERMGKKVDAAVKQKRTLRLYVCGACGRSNCNYLPTWRTVVVD
jgi:hypothetical protein